MVRVAVTQQEPLWFDLAGAVDKTCRLVEEAASNGAQLIAFPEVWITGYPMWIWTRPIDAEMATLYIKNSLSYDSPEMQKICDAAKQGNIAVVLGFSENDGNSLYIAQCIISATGTILMKRRKLKPTHMERTVFGDAGGKSLFNVIDVDGVGKVGALSCWEHAQPLLKYHTMSLREQIHVAAWPPLYPHEGVETHFAMSAEGCQTLSQAFAIESGTFVLHCTSMLTSKGIEAMKTSDSPLFSTTGGGYSAIFGPDGRRLSTPIPPDQEGIVYGDLPMDLILTVRHFVDAVGHYSRPELLWLGVDGREKPHVRMVENEKVEAEKEV
ncbi:carbon-nitrogen hydrolase [Lindgomyces ingoldianus]|uniref:Carbon-nitrogen hydrolase n=1 Tax=Lindgomyces ingoldianus TaxID=673940 RepID=A0ACB6QBW6_9PLEO|nr:carbon-nitrogen hydrolase [Lindgomyces ingoldianus]KAF2463597.1 carbon-nitrogen hydrolase [Lindgomyces ingoldianus]